MDQIVNDMNLAIHCGSLWLAVWQVNPIVNDMNLAIHCSSLWLAVWQVNPIVNDMNLAIHCGSLWLAVVASETQCHKKGGFCPCSLMASCCWLTLALTKLLVVEAGTSSVTSQTCKCMYD